MTAAFYQNETKFYVAVDCIILGFDQKELNVLLYKRKFEPMNGTMVSDGRFYQSQVKVSRKPRHACSPTVPALIIFLWNR